MRSYFFEANGTPRPDATIAVAIVASYIAGRIADDRSECAACAESLGLCAAVIAIGGPLGDLPS